MSNELKQAIRTLLPGTTTRDSNLVFDALKVAQALGTIPPSEFGTPTKLKNNLAAAHEAVAAALGPYLNQAGQMIAAKLGKARSLDLGELHRAYHAPNNYLFAFLWWGYAFIVGSIGIAAFGGTVLNKAIMILIGLIVVGCAAAMVWRGLQTIRNRKLYLYPGGIVYTHPSGRAKWYATWQDARVYWGSGSRRNFESYRIVFPQGGRVRWGIGTLGNQELLAQRVGPQARRLSAAHNTPMALDRLRSGQTLEFGPLLVDGHGVIYRDKDLHWREVASVALLGRIALIIRSTNKRGISVPMKRIPDLSVLLKVIEVAPSS